MIYGMLLRPHANSRYQEAVTPLALSELALLLECAGLSVQPRAQELSGAQFLTFEAEALSERQRALLSRHSSIYLLFAMRPDGAMNPVCARAPAFLGEDLTGILKYKGKTNESFTRFMINMALCSSDFSERFDERLSLLDPLCGRGTTLFEAVNRGFCACGADIDAREVDEGWRFFKKYLEYHRMKHEVREHTLTLPGRKFARVREVAFAREQGGRTLEMLAQDAQSACRAMAAGRFHLAVADLPYGVQHGPSGRETFDQLLGRTLPEIFRSLKAGGALALSFNTHTLPAAKVRAALADAGFTVLKSPPYEGLAHWVEQAIARDVAVGVKR